MAAAAAALQRIAPHAFTSLDRVRQAHGRTDAERSTLIRLSVGGRGRHPALQSGLFGVNSNYNSEDTIGDDYGEQTALANDLRAGFVT
jgi:hypothetical protein